MNVNVKLPEETPYWKPRKCETCKGHAVFWCSNCSKAGYCSLAHQLQDSQKHMATCFPLRTTYNAEVGRCVVATRDIRMGEELLQETPLMVAPNMHDKACLGCYQRVKPVPIMGWTYTCTACHWPVCDRICQESDHHKKMECPILASKAILPEQVNKQYRSHLIMTLRLLILKDKFGDISNKIGQLSTSVPGEIKMEQGKPVSTTTACGNDLRDAALYFIRDLCGMTVSDDLIEYMAHVVATNSIQNDEHASEFLLFRFASFLFYYASLITHDCIPNSRWVIHQEDSGYLGKFSAVRDIKEGETITRSYIPIWPFRPTSQRQSLLYSGWYFICKCARCLDPTEMGTLLSAVRCLSFRHYQDPCGPQPGCFLPPYPERVAENGGMARCTHCDNTVSFPKLMTNIVEPIEEVFVGIRDSMHEPTTATFEDLLSKVERLEKFMESTSKRLHSNHYILVNTEYEILQCLYLAIKDVPFERDEGCHAGIAARMIRSADKCLQIAAKLCPGISSFRGIVLFYKQHAMCSLLAKNLRLFSDQVAVLQFQDIQKFVLYIKDEITKTESVRRCARDILAKSCIGSFEKNMAEMLNSSLDDILNYTDTLSAFLGYDARPYLTDAVAPAAAGVPGTYRNEGEKSDGEDIVGDLLEIMEADTGVRFEDGLLANSKAETRIQAPSSQLEDLFTRPDHQNVSPGNQPGSTSSSSTGNNVVTEFVPFSVSGIDVIDIALVELDHNYSSSGLGRA